MSKFKMLDPKNVITKSKRMMEYHIGLFQNYLGDYEKSGDRYCFQIDSEELDIFYESNSKFMTKTFATKLHMRLPGIDMPYSWKAKSQFLGAMRMQGLIFKDLNKTPSEAVTSLNAKEALIATLFQQMQQVDLIAIELAYDKDIKELIVDIRPYAGTFIWVKIPPLYYDVRFKDEEIRALANILYLLKDHFRGNN